MDAEMSEVIRVSGHLRCSNIQDDLHNLQIAKCWTKAKSICSICKQKCFGLYLLKTRTYASVNTCKGSFLSCLKLLQQYRNIVNLFRCTRNIYKEREQNDSLIKNVILISIIFLRSTQNCIKACVEGALADRMLTWQYNIWYFIVGS